MCQFVAGYRLEHEDVVAFLKREELVKPDAKVSTDLGHQRFAEWAVAQIRDNVEGNRMVPWPQYMVRKDQTRVACLQTRIVRRDPETKKAILTESDLDRSSREKFIAMTEGAFQPERMHFFCCPAGYVRFPMGDNVPRG